MRARLGDIVHVWMPSPYAPASEAVPIARAAIVVESRDENPSLAEQTLRLRVLQPSAQDADVLARFTDDGQLYGWFWPPRDPADRGALPKGEPRGDE